MTALVRPLAPTPRIDVTIKNQVRTRTVAACLSSIIWIRSLVNGDNILYPCPIFVRSESPWYQDLYYSAAYD